MAEPSLIVAMTRRGLIGRRGALPWRLSADLKRFQALTMGHHLIMGRKTLESIGRPLPGRTSIVVTRQASYHPPPGVRMAHSLDEALKLAGGDEEPFVIGGGELYALALHRVRRLYVTWVESDLEGDTFFPPWSAADWHLAQCEPHAADAKNEYDYTFCIYERNPSPLGSGPPASARRGPASAAG